jgi:hypothetical protein
MWACPNDCVYAVALPLPEQPQITLHLDDPPSLLLLALFRHHQDREEHFTSIKFAVTLVRQILLHRRCYYMTDQDGFQPPIRSSFVGNPNLRVFQSAETFDHVNPGMFYLFNPPFLCLTLWHQSSVRLSPLAMKRRHSFSSPSHSRTFTNTSVKQVRFMKSGTSGQTTRTIITGPPLTPKHSSPVVVAPAVDTSTCAESAETKSKTQVLLHLLNLLVHWFSLALPFHRAANFLTTSEMSSSGSLNS